MQELIREGKILSVAQIMERLDEKVAGQEEAKKALAVLGFDKELQIYGFSVMKTNILLKGPSGCGKTYLIQTLCDILGLPFGTIDAPSVTGAGYRGEDLEQGLERLIANSSNNMRLAQNGIVFIDEFDKLLIDDDHGSSETVRAQLLKMIEGETINLNDHGRNGSSGKPTIDTTNITFILAGAFSFLKEYKRNNVVNFGKDSTFVSAETDAYESLTRAGFSPELIGRISRVVCLNPLTENDLIDILTIKKGSLLSRYIQMFDDMGVSLSVSMDSLQLAAAEAVEQGFGARGLNHIFKEILDDARFEILLHPGLYSECVITPESFLERKALLVKDCLRDVS